MTEISIFQIALEKFQFQIQFYASEIFAIICRRILKLYHTELFYF